MGIIEENRHTMASNEAAHLEELHSARGESIRARMADLAEVLEKPTFMGDVEVALVHHLGERAFTDESATKPYMDLVRKIESTTPDSEGKVLVFMVYDRYHDETGRPYGRQSSFVVVLPNNVQLWSKNEVEEVDTMSGRMVEEKWIPDKTKVTTKSLEFRGVAVTFDGDVLSGGDDIRQPQQGIACTVRSLRYARYANPYYEDNFDIFEGEPTILAGWEEIEAAFIDRLGKQGTDSQIQQALKLKEIFIPSWSVEQLEENAPRIASVIKAVEGLQAALGSLANND